MPPVLQPLRVDSLELSGTTVIEASAGTGKTYTITSLFVRLLIEHQLPIDSILVVTYTRAATAELRERIRMRVAQALRCARGENVDDPFLTQLCQRAAQNGASALVGMLENALANIEQAPILTIHAFCQRVLRDHAFESHAGFALQVTAHSAPLIEEIANDYYTAQLFDTPELRARALYTELGTLRALAARAGSTESIRIVPELSAGTAPSLEAWRKAQAECAALWEREREQVLAQVLALKGTQARNVERWGEHMDALLARDDFGVSRKHPFHTGFQYFTLSFAAGKAKTKLTHPMFAAAQQLWDEDVRLVASLDQEKVAFRAGFARYLRLELDRRTRQTEVCTFDALLSEVARALSGEHGAELSRVLHAKYQAALVDEFQDTDPAQYQMFKRIFAERPLLLIGDPKQAIYAFRGADVQAYLEARHDAGERVYTLEVNRRSDAALVEALNALYGRVERPFLREEIAYLPVSTPEGQAARFFPCDERGPLDLVLVDGPGTEEALRRDVARKVASDIAGLIESGARRRDDRHSGRPREIAASDIAVLCRTNREAHEVQLALSTLGVPSVLSGDASVFDSEDAEHIERVLSALAHPAEPRALRSFLCSIYAGFTAEGLLGLENDDASWDTHARGLRELHELFIARGFTQALRSLCTRYRVEERLLTRPDGLRRLTNLNHLVEILAEVSLSERLGPLGLLRWLETARRDADLRAELVSESHELRLESSDNAVQLTTVHKSKGLEYPIVYCPFLYKAATLRSDEKQLVRFHDPSDGVLSLDVGSPKQKEHAALAEQETMAEALRLLYVALTRAKHRVVVVLPSHKPSAQAALVYVLLGGGSVARVREQLEHAGVQGIASLLSGLASAQPAAFTLRRLDDTTRMSRAPVLSAPEPLSVRLPRRVLDNAVRTASFSALITDKSSSHEQPADYDALLLQDGPTEEPGSPLLLDAFPRGAGPGKLIHEVLERCTFDADGAAISEVARLVTRARGADTTLADLLGSGLAQMLATPLDESGLKLASIGARARVNELEFLFPVTSTLTPRVLGRCFRAHGAPASDAGYVRRVETLSFEDLRGQLRGFIDLIFEHEGRFYLVDYKSNRLGPQASDYSQPALVRAMAEHHYFLQYHIYAVALQRYLRQRLPGYTYERHFGGIYYLFLRGMAPSHALRTGVFFDLPPQALIDALDRCMSEGLKPALEVTP
jgi:exodeoxyribonuclease V beta subunit